MRLDTLTYQVNNLCRGVGKFIKEQSTLLTSAQVEEKGLHDLVSYVDRTAENMLMSELKKLLPEAGFIAEESGESLAETYNWIIDPLDGTTNFVHGVPVYSISIALQRDKQTISGVVYEINLEECFYAWEHGDAFLNGKKIGVSPTNLLSNSLLATGFPYHEFSRLKPYLSLFEELMQRSRGIRRLGSAAVDLAYVACGRFEAFYEYGLHPWDVAAGAFIVERAGGQLSGFQGATEVVFGTDILATNTLIHNELLQIIKKYEI